MIKRDPFTLTVYGSTSDHVEYVNDIPNTTNFYNVFFRIEEEIFFEEPFFVRLVHAIGLGSTHYVEADFVEQQLVGNGTRAPLLGCTAQASLRTWLPVAGNRLPLTGRITLSRTDGVDPGAGRAKAIVVIVEFSPKSLLQWNPKPR